MAVLLPAGLRRTAAWSNFLTEVVEPLIGSNTYRCAKQKSRHRAGMFVWMAHPRGFEPLTSASGGQRSIQLSYGRIVWLVGALIAPDLVGLFQWIARCFRAPLRGPAPPLAGVDAFRPIKAVLLFFGLHPAELRAVFESAQLYQSAARGAIGARVTAAYGLNTGQWIPRSLSIVPTQALQWVQRLLKAELPAAHFKSSAEQTPKS